MTAKIRFAGLMAAMVGAALLTACAQGAPKVATAAPPPSAGQPPAVSLAPKLVEQASAYRYYMSHVAEIAPSFQNGAAIAKSIEVGAAYEPKQFLQGAIAYGAVAALQDPAFVAGIRTFGADPLQRRQLVFDILKNPAYVADLPSAANAASLVTAALGGDAQRLYDNGKAVKQSAYDVQKQTWSKVEVVGRDQRLARAKALSATTLTGEVEETARLQQASVGAGAMSLSPMPASAPYSPVVTRALAVAALAALGEAGDANLETILAVMVEPNVGFCMNLSKLNLYQCLAVSKPHYEDVFCLGQHIMMDTGRCLIKAAGLPEPYEPRFVPEDKSKPKVQLAKKGSSKKHSRKG